MGSSANAEGSVALGAGSVANRAGAGGGYAAYTGGVTGNALTDINNTIGRVEFGAVSVGTGREGGNRQIINVAAGSLDSDAVNVAQLKGVQAYSEQGFDITADNASLAPGETKDKVKLGETVKYTSADGSIVTTVADNEIDFALGDDLSVGGLGQDGEDGVNGFIGVNGADGLSGIALNGANGTIGLTGPTGESGTIGVINGVPGVNGVDGITRIVIDDIQVATMEDGMKFAGNTGGTIAKKLNETLNIEGTLTNSADASGANLRVDSDNGKLNLVMAKNLTDLDSIMINNGGPIISSTGIDMGSNVDEEDYPTNRITNLGKGIDGTDAVNVDQLYSLESDTINKGLNFAGNDGINIHKDLGTQFEIVGNLDASKTASAKNIRTIANNGKLEIQLADALDVTSVTTGNTVMNTSGVSFLGSSTVSLSQTGLNNGGKQITGVASGVGNDSNAANMGDLNSVVATNKTKYYSVNSSAVGNADNLGATKPNAMAMGGNASATGGQAIAIGSGESGQNTTASGEQSIAIGANVESSGHSSIAIGGDDLDDASKTAGVNDTFKYYTGGDLIENSATPYTGHTESVGAASVAIGVKAQSEGDLSTAVGVRSSSSGDASSAFGMGSSASKKGSVALGAGSTTIIDATKEEKMTVGGVEYDIAGAAQGVGAQVSVGSEGHERQIKHVSGGAVNESSTDAINGSQLYATNIAVDKNSADIALGLDFTGDNSMTTVNRKLGQKLTIQGGETDLDNLASGNNIGVVANNTNSTLTIKLAKDLTSLDSATFGDVIISNKGIDNGFNRITNVAAGIDFTDAATVGQLEATTFALGKGWGISAQGANASKVVGGDSVDLNNTDGNIVLSKTTDSNDVSFDLNPNLSVDSIKAGANTFNNNGLTIVGGPSVTVAGINANNTKITNLMDGDITKDSKDAVNGGQLYVIANDLSGSIATNTTNITKNTADIVTNTANISTNTTNIKANKDKIDAGLNFGADSGAVINKPIGDGSVLSFKGGNNIKTTAEGSSIKFDLNGNINVESVMTGNTTVNNSGVTIKNGPSMTAAGIYAGNAETAPSMTAAGINAAGTKVTNVADGMAPRDAVNFGQLDAVSRGLGNSINELGYKIGEVEDDANAGISAAMAMSSLPQAFISGKPMIGGGIATYNGESAVAIGFSKMSNDGRWVMKLNGTADTQGNVGAAIGAGFHFD